MSEPTLQPASDVFGQGGADWPPRATAAREHVITRKMLLDGSFMVTVRAAVARAGAPYRLNSDSEIEAALADTLVARPDTPDLWIFCYGSLMWNPAFHYAERRKATLRHWQRRFCIWTPLGRGSPQRPGLTLGLERGGSTEGIAYRLPEGEQQAELMLVFRREMLSDIYHARWVRIEMADGPVDALTFVVNPDQSLYAGALTDEKIAGVMASAQGALGSCADYLWQTMAHLEGLGLRDNGLEQISRLTRSRLEQTMQTSS
jgi:glutathione-specific gamma-glutamylcyclotransferase